jgi:hypothetical protein
MIALRMSGVLLAPVTITPTKPLPLSHAKGLLWLDVIYRAARAAGGLDPVRVVPTHPDAFLREFERRVTAGERPPRVKDRVFQPDPAAWDRLTAEPAEPARPAGRPVGGGR